MDPRVVDDVIERLLQFGRELMMEEDSAVDEEKQQEKGQEVVKYADLLEAEIIAVCDRARQVFLGQNMLLDLEGDSIHICGDIHGQLWDLIKIFQLGGFPPSVGYLFLGDYVDRGKHGIETITLLLAYKIKNPEYFFLLRGNHECSMISRVYGFYDECKDRYSPKVWRAFMAAFDCMPVAAVVNERIFCVHGGLSPQLKNLQQINQICRPTQIGEEGIVCDLLWSDPENNFKGWGPNDRGVSYIFGKDVVNNFCEKHDMDLVCRAHQVVEDGYHFFCNKKLLTVFSASNYCGEFDNAGAMLTVGHNLRCSLQTWNNKKKTTTSGSTTTATRSSNGNGSSSNHK